MTEQEILEWRREWLRRIERREWWWIWFTVFWAFLPLAVIVYIDLVHPRDLYWLILIIAPSPLALFGFFMIWRVRRQLRPKPLRS